MRLNRDWQTGGIQIGKVYRLAERDLGRVGHCWMAGRLRVGDLVTPLRISGDGFYEWQLIEDGFTLCADGVRAPGFSVAKGARFGAYCMGTLLDTQPTESEWHLMMGGQSVHFTGESTR
jgi:hypothetical protein